MQFRRWISKLTIFFGLVILLILLSLPPMVLCEINVGSSEKGILKEQWKYPLHYYEWGWFGSSPTIIDFDESKKGLEIITGSDECCEY